MSDLSCWDCEHLLIAQEGWHCKKHLEWYTEETDVDDAFMRFKTNKQCMFFERAFFEVVK